MLLEEPVSGGQVLGGGGKAQERNVVIEYIKLYTEGVIKVSYLFF